MNRLVDRLRLARLLSPSRGTEFVMLALGTVIIGLASSPAARPGLSPTAVGFVALCMLGLYVVQLAPRWREAGRELAAARDRDPQFHERRYRCLCGVDPFDRGRATQAVAYAADELPLVLDALNQRLARETGWSLQTVFVTTTRGSVPLRYVDIRQFPATLELSTQFKRPGSLGVALIVDRSTRIVRRRVRPS